MAYNVDAGGGVAQWLDRFRWGKAGAMDRGLWNLETKDGAGHRSSSSSVQKTGHQAHEIAVAPTLAGGTPTSAPTTGHAT